MTGPKLAPTPEEPWLTSDREGKAVEFLVNTSATYWVLNMRSCKLSHKSCKIMRVSEKEIFFWVTGPNCAKLLQSCPPLWDPMNCSPPDSSVHGILQARILEWIPVSSPRGSSPPRDQTHISYVSCTDRQVLYQQQAPPEKPRQNPNIHSKNPWTVLPQKFKNTPIIWGDNLAKHLRRFTSWGGKPPSGM